MYEAARVGDPIGHSHAMAGMIAGTVVGGTLAALGGLASSALFMAGLAASCIGVGLVLVALSVAVGGLTAAAATSTRDSMAESGAASASSTGKILSGSPNVFINGKPAAIATISQVECSDHGPSMQMAQGSSTVFINGHPAARTGDKTNCDASVLVGSGNVRIGGATVTTMAIAPEVPEWAYKASDLTLLFAGLIGLGGGAKVGRLAALLERLPGINKLGRIICRAGQVVQAAAALAIMDRPIDVVSGQKFLNGEDELDFELPSRLPLRWQRYWRSGNPGDSVLGRGWSLPHESWLAPYQDGLVWRAPSGDYISFPQVPIGYRTYCEAETLWLEHLDDDSWLVYGPDDERWSYPVLQGTSPSWLSCISDTTGNSTDFIRDDSGLLLEVVDSAGQRIACVYQRGRFGTRLRQVNQYTDSGTLPLVSYQYDNEGQLVGVIGRDGNVVRRFGWRDGLMISHQDAAGLLNEYRWQEIDGLPRVVAYRNSAGEQLDIEYDFAGGLRSARRDDGTVMQWQLEEDDTISEYTAPDGRKYVLLYDDQAGDDRAGLCGVVLPGGAVRNTRWDRFNRLTEETDPAGRRTRYSWWRNSDRLLAVTGPDGATTRSDYDGKGRQIAQTGPCGDVTRYHYPDDQDNLPDSITDASGGVVHLVWNHQGLLTHYTDCSGSTSLYEYDPLGQLRAQTDAEGQITRYGWHVDGRPARIIRADESEETFTWQGARLASWQDSAGSVTRWQYNVLGLPVSTTDRIGRTVRCEYDSRGRLIALYNANGGRYQFQYDPEGRLEREMRPDQTQYRLELDARGFPVRRVEFGKPDREGGLPLRVKHYQFDDAGLLDGYSTGQAHWRCRRDRAGRMIELTRIPNDAGIRMGIEPDTLKFRYDAAGRQVAEEGLQGEVLAEYDTLGNRSALTTPQGDRLQWLMYGSGHVTAVKFNQQLVSEFTRDRLHRETVRSQGPLMQQRGYDVLGRRSWQSSGMPGEDGQLLRPEEGILWRIFRYTIRGELAGVTDALRGNIEYGYDAHGRLLSRSEPHQGVHQHFSYDAADNLVEGGLLAPVSDNRLLQWQNLFNRYDAWGNLIARRSGLDEQHYTYDADNRLIHARGNGPEGMFEALYHYDALGRRIRKSVTRALGQQRSTRETRFVWHGLRLLQTVHGDGARRTYTYDPAESFSPLAHIDQKGDGGKGEIYWYGCDLNGAPLEVTDEYGAVRWSGRYDDFGRVRHQTLNSHALRQEKQSIEQPLRYAGQYADDETGLHYNLFRYYDPVCGRFTSQDPIGYLGGFNLYQYGPNPLTWIDPLGLSFLEVVGDAAQKTGKKFQGAEIYKFNTKVKVGDVTFKKGDYFYLDNLHKDHYETFSSLDKSKGVFNLDGSFNEKKSIKAVKRKGPGC